MFLYIGFTSLLCLRMFLWVELESLGGGLLIHARPDFRLLDLSGEFVDIISF